MFNYLLVSLQQPKFGKLVLENPLNGSFTQVYEQKQQYQKGNNSYKGIFDKYLNNTDGNVYSIVKDNTINENTLYDNLTQSRIINQTMYVYQNNESSSNYIKYSFAGFFNYKHNKGVMRGLMLRNIKLNDSKINESQYLEQFTNKSQFPNSSQVLINQTTFDQITKGEINSNMCILYNYMELLNFTRKINENRYLPDISSDYSEAIKINATHENVSSLSQRVISQECGIDMQLQGPIYNNAYEVTSTQLYAFLLLLFNFFGLLSGLRMLYLLNSPVRVNKISVGSFVMQCCYDCFMGGFHVTYLEQMQYSLNPLILISCIFFLNSIIVDFGIILQCIQHQQFGNRIMANFISTMVFFCFIAYLFLQQYITSIINFLIIMVISSYWFIQSITSIIRDIPPKALTFDYLVVQSIVKYAPIVYFYGFQQNFLKIQVNDWYIIVMSVWFGLQAVLIFGQFFFGGRFGLKCLRGNKTSQQELQGVLYINQKFDHFMIKNADSYVSNTELLKQANSSKTNIFQYLQTTKLKTITVPFINKFQDKQEVVLLDNEDFQKTENVSNENQLQNSKEIADICQNPLHQHSLFYNKDLSIQDFAAIFPCLLDKTQLIQKISDGSKICCFYLFEREGMDDSFQCPICMDSLFVLSNYNQFPMCLLNGHEEDEIELNKKYLMQNKIQIQQSDQQIFITPCKHCYHAKCLCKWGAENLQCPVDREKLPPLPNNVWWE